MKKRLKDNYPKILFGLFLLLWIFLAISPKYRGVWVVENVLSVLFITFLIITYKKFRFSNLSYTLFFIFFVLHTLGSHFTYTNMPLFNWIKDLFDLSRNHYDRLVHFLFGLMFFIPCYEFISEKLKIKYFWGYLLAFLAITALKGIYEVVEFAYVLITRNEIIGAYFLGMQGDQWDAQKDLAWGLFGSAAAWFILWLKTKNKVIYALNKEKKK